MSGAKITFATAIFLLLLPLLLLLSLGGCKTESEGLLLFAAASTRDALTEVVRSFDAARVRTSFAASSTLARQIEAGAPADIYISAHRRWMDHLAQRGLLERGTRADLMAARLALVAPRGRGFDVRFDEGSGGRATLAAAFSGRLALGDPAHVPLGIYARQALEKLGWWSGVAARVVPALDARAALAFVERGECQAGIVYEPDARRSTLVEIVALLPTDSHLPVVYQVALIRGRKSGPSARALRTHLLGPMAAEVLARHGFAAVDAR